MGHLTLRADDRIRTDLVIANRILSNEEVVDAYGHVSIRNPKNPNRFFLARSLAPSDTLSTGCVRWPTAHCRSARESWSSLV